MDNKITALEVLDKELARLHSEISNYSVEDIEDLSHTQYMRLLDEVSKITDTVTEICRMEKGIEPLHIQGTSGPLPVWIGK